MRTDDKEGIELLKRNGWEVICFSPFEIEQEEDGVRLGFATGEGARTVLEYLKLEEGLNGDDYEKEI